MSIMKYFKRTKPLSKYRIDKEKIALKKQRVCVNDGIKFMITKYAIQNGPTRAKHKYYKQYGVTRSSINRWCITWKKAAKELRKQPKNALQAGIASKQLGRPCKIPKTIRVEISNYIREIRQQGCEIDCLTTGSAIHAFLQQYGPIYLKQNGGNVDPYSEGMIRRIWNDINYVQRKMNKKLRRDTQYDLTKIQRKNNIPDWLNLVGNGN